jgi:hypothetical protein
VKKIKVPTPIQARPMLTRVERLATLVAMIADTCSLQMRRELAAMQRARTVTG